MAETPALPSAALRTRLDHLFNEHASFVARLAYRLLGRDDEVDDIVQDVFIILFRGLETIREEATLRAWLRTTTVRVVQRRLRVRRIGFLLRIGERVDPEKLSTTFKGGSTSTGEERVTLWNIHQALETVSVKARIAWALRYLEEESVEEVARMCGCSRSTAKRRIADAHEAVKKALSSD